jgi:hypothetical protein
VASTNKTLERRIISIVSDSTVALLDHLIRAQQQRWRKREAGHHSGQSSLQLLLELADYRDTIHSAIRATTTLSIPLKPW